MMLTVISFFLTRLYLPSGCTWLFSKYVIKAPPIAVAAEVIISWATLLLFSPLLLLIIGGNLIARAVISLYFRYKYGPGGKFSLMGGRDSFVSHDTYANSCNHYSLYVIKGACDLQRIREKFRQILKERGKDGEVIYDRMKRRLTQKFGYYCWEHMGDSFKIEDHIKYITPDAESRIFNEDEVFHEMQQVYDFPFKGEKPQWEILVIPQLKYKHDPAQRVSDTITHYGFLVRCHHAIMDGISAGNALNHYMADRPLKLTVDPLSKEHEWGWFKTLLAYTQVFVMGPRSLSKVLLLDEKNCFHGPELTGPKTIGWSRQVNVDALRKVKDSTRTSVTAVLVSALGGGVRNLAVKKRLPVPTQVHAFPTIGILPFPDIKPRNRFTMALLPLCIGLDTSLERLKSAERSLKNLLRSPDVLTNYHMMPVFGVLPVKMINLFLEKCHATLLLSNVPGPAEKATIFGGDLIEDIGIWAPIQLGIGIGMSLFSYGGTVRATVILDKTAGNSEDVPTLVEEFEKELTNLAKLSQVPVQELFQGS